VSQMPNYELHEFDGVEEQLIVHLCQVAGEDAVEIIPVGSPTVMTKEQFTAMVGWVYQQFELLAQDTPFIH
jgi:hypothetical protein